ncbi:enoyl-[acyl-carrier-protein] reductase FabK [Abyssisolibacter fermentans]|uniref:enoyl-[acyl-carrier-protein] reductase FabK n=1 Tax=Abyssisolibacter fermentans TaxID=1766203 RepID=UPI00082E6F96|nr:enoyl-[acyl-carrier-protein] reductase FabK [Abyssisolibacter fermentans]
MIKSKISKLLNIKYPILQGGMAWISDAQLAAAVSNAGGLGIIAAGNAPVDLVRAEIRKAKQLTDKPFGVNLMLLSPYAEEIAQLLIDEDVKVVVTGAGNPGKYLKEWKSKGIKVIPVVASSALAVRMERSGADAVIAEGMESGGHVGKITTMSLLPQVVDSVNIPVIGAGGIADGRGLAAAFLLGAEAVQIGTRFLVANECQVHDNYKARIIKARDTDTVITGRSTGHPVRIIKNKLAKEYIRLEKEKASVEEIEELGKGSLYNAAILGEMDRGSIMAGQCAGMIKKKQSSKEIIEEIYSEALELFKKFR